MAEARRIAEEEATEARREAAEERRRERDYRRQRKAQEAEASTARQLAAEAGTGPPIHTTCNCHRDDWCTCGAARIAEEHLQPATHATTALKNNPEGTREDNTATPESTAKAQDKTCNCPWANWCTCGNWKLSGQLGTSVEHLAIHATLALDMRSTITALHMVEEPSSTNNKTTTSSSEPNLSPSKTSSLEAAVAPRNSMVREGTSGKARKTPNKPGNPAITLGIRPAPRPALASPQARLYAGLGPSQKIPVDWFTCLTAAWRTFIALASPQARLYDGLGPSQKIARPDQSSNQPTTPKIAEGA